MAHGPATSAQQPRRKLEDVGVYLFSALAALVLAFVLSGEMSLTHKAVFAAVFTAATALAIYEYRVAVASAKKWAIRRDDMAAQVAEAQVNYRSIFDNASEGIFQCTPQGNFIAANPSMARMLGRTEPEALIADSNSLACQMFFADRARWSELLWLMDHQGSVADFEAELTCKDGSSLWVTLSMHCVRDEDDELLYLEGAMVDATHRHWAERRRALSDASSAILEDAASVQEAQPKLLQAVCEALDWDMGAIWEVSLPENALQCVEVWHSERLNIDEFEAVSVSLSPLRGECLAGRVWQTGKPAWVINFAEKEPSQHAVIAARSGMRTAFGIPIKVGGEVKTVLEFFSPQASQPDPELLQMIGMLGAQMGHLVERKLTEEALRNTVIRKAAILESALDCVIIFDHEGRILEWNPAAERAFGWRRVDVLGQTLAEVIIPESFRNGPGNGIPLYSAAASTSGKRSEIMALRANGSVFPAEIAISRVQVQGRPLYTAYLREVTESKHLEQLKNEYAAVVSAADDAVFSLTPDGVVTSWNAAAEKIYGYGAAEILHRPVSVLTPPEGLSDLHAQQEKLRRGEVLHNVERVVQRKDGKRICVMVTEAPIRNNRGLVTGVVSKSRDVTEHKLIEGEAIQTKKMEAVGRLAGGVAHDFNNILTAILGYSDVLLRRIPLDSPYRTELLEIRKAGEFAASLTQQLLAFSRGQTVELEVLELNSVIQSMRSMLRRLIGEQIQLVLMLSDVACTIWGDRGQLEQVVLNLVLNSRDAMPKGGAISVQTALVTISADGLGDMAVPEGRWVRLVVRDTGEGMPESVKEHIFEPFFTTKKTGRGTGLGLSICYGIIKQCGGHIVCHSAQGVGTSFEIFFPVLDEAALAGSARGEMAWEEFSEFDLPCGTETILVIDEERSIRRLKAHVLQRLGYTVLEAEDHYEAEELLRDHPHCRVNLIIAAVVLPNFGEKELSRWMEFNCSEATVLLTSGYEEVVVFGAHSLSNGMACLQKPFTPSELAVKVRDVLEKRRG